nr:reverse transcriptase domain-containing protein [Tanacetum cinerariifolium]
MIIEADIGDHCIHRMYVDGGSASEIMYEHCFSRLRPEFKKQLIPATTPLIGFSGEIIWPIGQIQLLVKIKDEEHSASAWMNFMVVRSQSSYNGIIRRLGVRKLQAVPSTAHGMLKILVEGGVITLKNSKLVSLECVMVFGPEETLSAAKPIIEERVKIAIILEYPEQTVMIGSTLTEGGRNNWRMCIDFKDLNKAYPKDGYPLPEIDWKVESLCRFPFKCFQDAYKGYHQIQMATEDEEKTVFITSQGIFCYMKMPFGLRNAGATYQRLVDKAFHKQIGRNMEVYVDDLVIKSRMEDRIVRDIEETFKTLREINMKLNHKKYAFGVEEGMFLGNKVNAKGLKIYPDKVDAILSLPSPKCLKNVQKLNGKLTSLNRKAISIETENEETFKQIKQIIAELPMLTEPMEKEEHIVYLAAAKETVSAVLMMEKEAKQMPIYFVTRALRGPELNNTSMEKLVLSLVHASKRLKRPRVSVKGHILADFIVERPEEDSPDTPMEEEEELTELWILFTDGSFCTDGSGAGLILTNPEGMECTYALRLRFDATNNEAEYKALIAGLRIAEQLGVKNLHANVDSRLVANQVNGTYVAKEADMIHYLEKVKALTGSFKEFSIKQIPRSENKKANALSKIASTSFALLSRQVLVEELTEKSISEIEILAVVDLTNEFLSLRFFMKDIGEADVILVSTPMGTSEKLRPNFGQTRVLKYLKKTMDCTLSYTRYILVLEGYTNARWISNTKDNSFTTDWVFLLAGGVISWASKKQTCITSSTMKFEFVALAAVGKEVEWLRNMILKIPLWSKAITYISIRFGNATTLAKAYSQMYNWKSKHLGVRHSMIRKLIMNEVTSIKFVRSQHNLVDHLTKGLARDLVLKSI